MRKGIYFLGMCLVTLAVALFYLIFFKLAPWIAGTLPTGPWHNFLTIVVYVVIGYFGGIGLPAVILIFGLMMMFGGVWE